MDFLRIFWWLCKRFLDWCVNEKECNDLDGKWFRFLVKVGEVGLGEMGVLFMLDSIEMDEYLVRVLREGVWFLEEGIVGVWMGLCCCWMCLSFDRFKLWLWFVMIEFLKGLIC